MVVCAAGGLVLCLISLAFFQTIPPRGGGGHHLNGGGIFGSVLKDTYGFEFGSSRGSKEKDERVTAAMMGGLK